MKKYHVTCKIDGLYWSNDIEGTIEVYRNHYYIKDKDGKTHYYPIHSTVIKEL